MARASEHAPGTGAERRESRKSCKCVKVHCTIEQSYPQVIHKQNHMDYSQWVIFALFLLTAVAFSASVYALRRCTALYVTLASVSSRCSALETQERLTPSKLAALSEFSEALTRAEELLLKVNRREIARAKARSEDGTFAVNGTDSLKDQLRRRAGLRAGQPAPHQ